MHGCKFTPCLDNNPLKIWLEFQKFRLAMPTVTTQPGFCWLPLTVYFTDNSAAAVSTHTHWNTPVMQEHAALKCKRLTGSMLRDAGWNSIHGTRRAPTHKHTRMHSHSQILLCTKERVQGTKGKWAKFHSFISTSPFFLCVPLLPHFLLLLNPPQPPIFLSIHVNTAFLPGLQ